MRENPDYALTDRGLVAELIREHPWATMVSNGPDGPVASHYPFLLEGDPGDLVLLSHVGRPDEKLHALGTQPLLVIFYGPSGYVSPSWYEVEQAVPTWNFVTAHCYGTPEILSDEENLDVLEKLVDHFEDPLPEPFRMRGTVANSEYAERIVHGTVGFRMRIDRFVAKDKMSQGKPAEVVDRVVTQLRNPGPYRNDQLADRMDRVHGRTS